MLDIPPAESEKRSWFCVLLGALATDLTIPVACALREAADAGVGREALLYAGLVMLLLFWPERHLRAGRKLSAPKAGSG